MEGREGETISVCRPIETQDSQDVVGVFRFSSGTSVSVLGEVNGGNWV